jgi:hypothetical protein
MASLAESYAANRLPGDVAWAVCRQFVDAIAYVHRVGVVHGGLFDPALLVIRYADTVCDRSAFGQHLLVGETIRKRSADVLSSLAIPHPRCNAHYLSELQRQ